MAKGFLIAAPQSGSGKTTITLGLLRAFTREKFTVQSAKAGPDFIDPAFHAAATGATCVNLDPWAMRADYLKSLIEGESRPLVIEAMMGLFDGGADGNGSAADLADMLDLPVILVVDASKQSHSIAALVQGFLNFRPSLNFGGVILNKVGSERHELMLCEALEAIGARVLGCLRRDADLVLPSRHLGLVMAGEHRELDSFLERAADLVESSVDMDALRALAAGGSGLREGRCENSIAPPGQNIAVARDEAFAFCYPHLIQGWCKQGANVSFFSPLNDESPASSCDAVYLPGGYPELHAARLAGCSKFKLGLAKAHDRGAFIYGECGGFMTLGQGLIDANGDRHEMVNLLPIVTSFEKRKLHLGYREIQPIEDLPFCPAKSAMRGHEFHYSTIEWAGVADALFKAADARGQDLGICGMREANVAGSYLHIIDRR